MKTTLLSGIIAATQLLAASCSKGNDDNIANVEVKTPTYQYTTTNWDDGWASNIKEDWVEVTKGAVKVLLHYPRTNTNISADPEPYVNNAWNILVAPRYSNLQNYKVVSPSLDYERAYLGFGTVTENASGKTVFVSLFKKGNSGWVETITTDKTAFIQQFSFDPATVDWSTSSDIWNALRLMPNYNRFAVAATDIGQTGKWTNNFGANTFYYSLYTGLGGMSSYSATEEFIFNGASTYQWQLFTANSAGGGTNFAKAQSAGNFSLRDNWHASFSNIEGKQVEYPVWFGAAKGGRVLFINGNPFSWIGT